MTIRRLRLRHVGGVGLALALLLGLGAQAFTATPARAATGQFHGVNWADPNDNFITGVEEHKGNGCRLPTEAPCP